jgi:hypothetical protein
MYWKNEFRSRESHPKILTAKIRHRQGDMENRPEKPIDPAVIIRHGQVPPPCHLSFFVSKMFLSRKRIISISAGNPRSHETVPLKDPYRVTSPLQKHKEHAGFFTNG